jgi:hypothetical protein
MNRTGTRRKAYWTRERVILGLQRFYQDFGYTPLACQTYQDKRAFTGRTPSGRASRAAWHQLYPSMYAIGKFFATMRTAWTAAGFDVNQANEEWSPMEDWFVLETCGILSREEVAAYLKRTTAAVKRRLHDLGHITANERWGMTVSKVAHKLGISETIVRRYLTHGTIPFFKGYKLIYLNPADLPKIVEVDWSRPIDPELESLIRRCLIQRALKIIKFGPAWRDHEVYKFGGNKDLFTKRITVPREPSLLKEPPPPRTDDLRIGDWITVNRETLVGIAGRVGVIKAIHYSPQNDNRRDGTKRKCWLARIEFPRLRNSALHNEDRIRYTLPLDCLDKVEKPEIPKKPLSMKPEAIRGRKRWQESQIRGRNRFEEIKGEIT